MDRRRPFALLLVAVLAAVPPAACPAHAAGSAQPPEPPPGSRRPTAPTFEPDLGRIRRGLDRPERVDWRLPEGTRPMFRVDVEGKLPDIWTWLGDPRDLNRGGTPLVPSYHDEFLRMVTPEELRASYTNGEMAQLLATAFAGQLALKSIVSAIKGAVAGARERAACEEVRDSMRQLNEQRARAGLPPVPLPDC